MRRYYLHDNRLYPLVYSLEGEDPRYVHGTDVYESIEPLWRESIRRQGLQSWISDDVRVSLVFVRLKFSLKYL